MCMMMLMCDELELLGMVREDDARLVAAGDSCASS
jgi:hypothetical protein